MAGADGALLVSRSNRGEMASKRSRFGRVKVRLNELQQHGVVDFAKLLKASEPAEEPDADAGRRAPMQVGEVLLADEKPRGDSIPGEDMSDDEDNRGVGRKSRGGRGIFEDIIAKWSSLSVPDAGKDSDEGGDGSGGGASDDGDEAQDSGNARAIRPCVLMARHPQRDLAAVPSFSCIAYLLAN